ncbi:nucleotide exchange factor GrpE [Geothrix campi]|jgi:molecular chaperone GrpE|uniref:nucleotide exchange factor GrpE n=1 Tax=Geothrix campi TaxID=2966450 RepID=UPI002147B4FE|nr:nucleotide exchange factor GrpE [Geothrix sp. SG10]
MTTGTPREPHDKPASPAGEPEDVVDLSLDDALDGDLQSVADEVASEYPAPAEEGTDFQDREEPRIDLESALTEAERQMEEMLRREGELMDQHRRLAADFNNFRNRAQRDIAMAVEQAERKILLEMLPVLDNFERGLGASYQDVDSFRAGVELIQKQFLEALRRMSVEPLPLKIGDAFDALHAEALTTFSDPNLPDGAVAAVYERGYNLKGQLLRPARVVVNRHQDPGKS